MKELCLEATLIEAANSGNLAAVDGVIDEVDKYRTNLSKKALQHFIREQFQHINLIFGAANIVGWTGFSPWPILQILFMGYKEKQLGLNMVILAEQMGLANYDYHKFIDDVDSMPISEVLTRDMLAIYQQGLFKAKHYTELVNMINDGYEPCRDLAHEIEDLVREEPELSNTFSTLFE